jgi:hypothetical protein
MKFDIIFVFSPIQLRRGLVWCLFDLNDSAENQQLTARDTHTQTVVYNRENI